MFDYIVIGAGFSGAVMAERIATQLKKRVLIIEQRNHIGGNCYDQYNEDGLLVYKYGPRVFHTPDKQVWDYVSQFTEWKSYQHKVAAYVDGHLIPIPFNLNSLKILFPEYMVKELTHKLIKYFGFGNKIPILELRKTEEDDLKMLADFIYNKIYLNYTYKQWGLKPDELDEYVTGRMPIHISYDDRHSKDSYQGIPRFGYNQLFKKMLGNQNIKVMLNTDYREVVTVNHHTKQIKFMGQLFEGKLIFTGKIDELFDYCYGELPYRTVDFKIKTLQQEHYQDVASINYPNDYDFTRVTEVKHLTGQTHPYTAIVEEYHRGCTRKDVPYYPIPAEPNLAMFAKYQQLAKEYTDIVLSGHLADYRYYDMNVAVLMALEKFNNEINV
ncbi:MAG: UDP-galactopyranose mutase [Neisseriales bacterium]|nr:MAG: UDP-galactopyranose mutase [Neisseriales bacterium]